MESNDKKITEQMHATKFWRVMRVLPEILAIFTALGLAWVSALKVIVALVSALVMLTSILWKRAKWWQW